MTFVLDRTRRAPLLPSLLLVALVPALAACGSDGDGGGGGSGGPITVAPYTEGSRLRPMLLDAGGGATTFLSFFDQELGLRCWFQPTVDGDLRCLPRSEDAWYRDEACTSPAVPAGCLGPEGATLEGTSGEECDQGAAVAVFVPTSTEATEGERVVGYTDDCGPQGDRVMMVTAEAMPLDRFVRGEIEEVVLGRGLGARRIVAEDGATLVTHLLRDGHPCAPAELDGELRCLDVHRTRLDGHDRFFSGESCSGDEVVVTYVGCAGEVPSVATRGEAPECGGTLHALGDVVEGDAASVLREDGTCSAFEPEVAYRRVGAAIAPDDLPAMTDVERGTGRVVVRDRMLAGVTAPGGDRPMAELFDTGLGAACTPGADPSGVVRCFPRGNGLAWYAYADPSCTEPLFRGDDEGSCDLTGDPRFATQSDGISCPHTLGNDTRSGVVIAVLERGAPYDGPVYGLNDVSGECTGGDPRPGLFFAVGAVHPPEDFPVLALR